MTVLFLVELWHPKWNGVQSICFFLGLLVVMLHREALEFTILSPRFKFHLFLALFVPELDRSLLPITFFHSVINFHLSWGMGSPNENKGRSLPRGWWATGAAAQRGRQELCSSGGFWVSWTVPWAATLTGLVLETPEIPSQQGSAVLPRGETGKAHLKTSLRSYRQAGLPCVTDIA